MYMNTHTHTHTHTRMYVCTHNNTDSHEHTLGDTSTTFTDTRACTHIHSDANAHGYKYTHKWHTHAYAHLHVGTTIINVCMTYIHTQLHILSWVRRQSGVLSVVFFTCYGYVIIKLEVHYELTISISCNCTHVLFYFCEIVYSLDTV